MTETIRPSNKLLIRRSDPGSLAQTDIIYL